MEKMLFEQRLAGGSRHGVIGQERPRQRGPVQRPQDERAGHDQDTQRKYGGRSGQAVMVGTCVGP